MKNIWAYPSDNDWIRIRLKNGQSMEGAPVIVNDTDETESGEIEITIKTANGMYTGAKLSDIDDIDELD